MKSLWERWYPLALSALILSVLTFPLSNFDLSGFQNSAQDIFIGATTVSGIVIGFLSASQAVLLSLDGRRIIVRLREANAYRKLLAYLMDAVHWAFILATISSLGLFLDFGNPQSWYILVLIAWLYALLTMGFSCYRTLRLLNKILHSLD